MHAAHDPRTATGFFRGARERWLSRRRGPRVSRSTFRPLRVGDRLHAA